MSDDPEFNVGDRVRVKESEIQYFVQPWRGRFERGIEGTVAAVRHERRGGETVFVQFHPKRKVKREYEWRASFRASYLEHAEGHTNER